MNYLKISSLGLIDPQALTLLGASTKRNKKDLIGRFGSGNKYALAYLLRNNHEVIIYSGNDQINVGTKSTNFEGHDFNVITINDKETSLTTEMGPDWKLWHAIREIYSNALDQGEAEIDIVKEAEPITGKTTFYISTNSEIFDFVGNMAVYFADDRAVLDTIKNQGRILKPSSKTANVFSKGIRCYDTERKCIYDYDFFDIDITEDRVIKYSWELPEKIWRLISLCNDSEIIRSILNVRNKSELIEFNLNGAFINYREVSKEFLEVISSMEFSPSGLSGILTSEEIATTCIVPDRLYEWFVSLSPQSKQEKFDVQQKNGKYFKENSKALENPQYKNALDRALEFLSECNFDMNYEIRIAKFTNKHVLGMADVDKEIIYLSENALQLGIHDLVNTIIEEYIHIKHNVSDESRAFQTASINELINYMKKANAYNI